MPQAPTPILGLPVPTVGGDVGTWGGELVTGLNILDQLGAFFVSQVSQAYSVLFGVFPEVIVLATGGVAGIPITLPACATWKNKIALVKKVDAGIGSIPISCVAGKIDGAASYQLSNQYQYVRLLSDGINANIVGNN